MYYIYIIRCKDNSLYTGITTEPERRLREHITKKRGARYTGAHGAVFFEALWQAESRSAALCGEAAIKKMKKEKKEELIQNPFLFTEIMKNKGLIVKGEDNVKEK